MESDKKLSEMSDQELRKWCVEQVCKSSITQTYINHIDCKTPLNVPLAVESDLLYQFIKEGTFEY